MPLTSKSTVCNASMILSTNQNLHNLANALDKIQCRACEKYSITYSLVSFLTS